MKGQVASGCAAVVGGVVAIAAIIALILGLNFAYTKYYEGWQMSQHARNVHQSVNYVEGANERARDMILQYQTAVKAGDTAHANALLRDICGVEGNLAPDLVASDVAQFLAVHPCI